jgi:peptidyl-dipeptidase Dcp
MQQMIFYIYISDIEEISGIPQNALEAAKNLAEEKGYSQGWVFTLQMPSYIPVIQYAKNRELRKKMNLAYGTKNSNGKFDNREIILKIIELRNKRAKLLGFNNHSEYVLDQRMAKTPKNVFTFLDDLFEITYPVAKNELEELKKLTNETDGITDFMPWDTAYYSEKLKEKKFNFDQELLRPYFKAENVINGIFEVAKRMYGLRFSPINSIPLYHLDVKTYEVIDTNNNNLGLLYMDLHPRATKNSGAWMDTLRIQGWNGDTIETPQIVICGNMTPSTKENPSLLSFDEVRTVFHEFGHALHGLFSTVKYKSLASPNVYWDFVELPSQIMENWLLRA